MLGVRSGRVRAARKLQRRTTRTELGLFLAEGPQAVREALASEDCVREVFAGPAQHDDLRRSADAAGVTWHEVDDRALEALSGTVQSQGIVAVCRAATRELDDLLAARPDLVAVCVEIRDPGNAGTVIRCADAAGADGVVFAGESVDPYNGKAVRASAGSLFHLPPVSAPDVTGMVERLRENGMTVLAADAAGEVDLDEAADGGLLARRTAWVFGNEAHGLPDDMAAQADQRVRIPIHGRAESLNLATAAAVCLYASARAQRRAR